MDTHSLLGTAEDQKVTALCYIIAAAEGIPRLQTVDGLSPATNVAMARLREEAVRVSRSTVRLTADVVQVLSHGRSRWERNV